MGAISVCRSWLDGAGGWPPSVVHAGWPICWRAAGKELPAKRKFRFEKFFSSTKKTMIKNSLSEDSFNGGAVTTADSPFSTDPRVQFLLHNHLQSGLPLAYHVHPPDFFETQPAGLVSSYHQKHNDKVGVVFQMVLVGARTCFPLSLHPLSVVVESQR